ncbi:MAG: glutathione S-transferase family protein [Symploca sp. SIO3E6]|nr:glutathione S-transferase family protein [Caldora sp. SIO3E6]
MAKYTLYWSPLTSSFAPHVVLAEIGVDYELKLVDFERQEHKSESFLKLNPNGLVPVMLLENGSPMYESAAMVMYLADSYPEVGLSPSLSDPERYLYNQWLFYMSIEIYPAVDYCFKPEFISTDPSPSSQAGIRQRAGEKMIKCWKILDQALQDKLWLVGDRFTVCDIYMLMMTLWHIPKQFHIPNLPLVLYDDFFKQFKNVSRNVAATAEHPTVKKIMKLYPPEGLVDMYKSATNN